MNSGCEPRGRIIRVYRSVMGSVKYTRVIQSVQWGRSLITTKAMELGGNNGLDHAISTCQGSLVVYCGASCEHTSVSFERF